MQPAPPPPPTRTTAKHVRFPIAVAVADDNSRPAVVVGMPTADADPDSDSDKEHPMHEPEFVFHAVDGESRQIHHRARTAADVEREERLRAFMIFPQVILCAVTFIFACLIIYLVNNPEVRAQADFRWDVLVTVSSALVMIFSLLSVLLSYLGVYYFDGWPGLNRYLP